MRSALLLVAWLAMAGCHSASRDPQTVVFLIESSPTNLDPRVGTDAQSERIDALLFDARVSADLDLLFLPHVLANRDLALDGFGHANLLADGRRAFLILRAVHPDFAGARRLASVASAVVRAIAPLPTTAKIRIGWDADSVNAVQVAKILGDAGIAALTVTPAGPSSRARVLVSPSTPALAEA